MDQTLNKRPQRDVLLSKKEMGMKDKLLMMGYMVLVGICAPASSCGTAATSCEQISASTVVSTEEAVFVSKLSESYIQTFNLMSIEQRHEAVEVAQNEALDADVAVDKVLEKHQLVVVDGVLKPTIAH